MKTVIFFRHGKSDWGADYGSDFERPIAKRGRKAAQAMGRFLSEIDQIPDSIISSAALRARQTMEVACDSGKWKNTAIRITETLYESVPQLVLREINQEPDTTQLLLLVGHEPTWSETVSHFIGGGQVRFPTAAMACIDLDFELWEEVGFGTGELIWFIPPRLLKY